MSDDLAYLPKYMQIMETLRRRIKDGTYPVGTALPSEAKLGKEFGASRPTVVRALNDMQLRGEIERVHGRGSFVRQPPAESGVEQTRPGLAILDRRETPERVSLVEVGDHPAPPAAAGALGLEAGASVVLRRYVSVYDGIPSELVSLWIPVDLARTAGLDHQGLLTVPVRELLVSACTARLVRLDERMSARPATEHEAELLKIKPGDALLTVAGTLVDADGRGVLVVDVALPGSLHELEYSHPL